MPGRWSPPDDYQRRPIAILGAGVLGRRIAACFVSAGYHCRIRDPSASARFEAEAYIRENLSSFTATSQSQRQAGTYGTFEDLPSTVKDAWLVVEVVPEVLRIKEDTFAEVEKYAPKDCILASNSSSYKSGDLVTKLHEETKRRTLNTHFMMPPEINAVELMTDGFTDEPIFPFMTDRLLECGLLPVRAYKESTGFLFNRIWAAVKRECLMVLADGVSTPEDIDSIWCEIWGSSFGPCTLMDQVGLDTVAHIEEHYITERTYLPRYEIDWLQEHYIKPGNLGGKSGKGGLLSKGTSTKLIALDVGLAAPIGNGDLTKYGTRGQVLELDLNNKNGKPNILIPGQSLPDGIDICGDRVFWSNMHNLKENDGTILSAKLDGSDIQTIIPAGKVHTPKQITIEQTSKKLYFCDREGMRVMRCNLDGSEHETLVERGDWHNATEKSDQLRWCVGIAVSKKLNKFFWSQKGGSKANQGRIFAAPIDMSEGDSPTDRQDIELIADNLPEPIDLDLDDEAGVLYWTDRGEIPLGNTLNKKTVVGTPCTAEKALGRQIIAQGLGEGIGLKLDKQNGCLYVADLCGRLWKCGINGGKKEKIYESSDSSFTGLTLLRA